MKILKVLPVVGIILFVYILYTSDLGRLYSTLKQISPAYPLLALSILIPRTIIYTKKWDYILKKQGIDLPYKFVIRTYLIATFYGAVTPGWLGTYIRIPYIMKRGKIQLGKATSNLVIDTLIDAVSIFIVVLIGALLLLSRFPNLLPIVGLVFLIIISLIIYFSSKKRSEKYFRVLVRFLIPSKYKQEIFKQFDAFYENIPKLRTLIFPFLLSIICWILSYTQIYIMAQGLGIQLEYFYFILVYPVAFLVELLPISISGFGTREAALIALFSGLIARTDVISLSLTGYFVTVLAPAAIGALLALKDIRSKV